MFDRIGGGTVIQAFIDAHPLNRYHFLVFGLCMLGLLLDAYEHRDRVAIADGVRGGDALGLELPVIEGVSAMNRIMAELASDRSDLVGDGLHEVA